MSGPAKYLQAYLDEFDEEEGACCLIKIHYAAPTHPVLSEIRALAKSRSARLGLPLLLVTAVIVPPISFVTVQQWYGYRGSFLDFLGHYFMADNHFCQSGHCMPVPLPNPFHLWFVLYLWNYTMLLIALIAWAPGVLQALQRTLEHLHVDFAPGHRQPSALRLGIATLVALVGSLLADVVLVKAIQLLF